MKKQILSVAALVAALCSFGQSVPNGDFEMWSTALSYEEPVYKYVVSSTPIQLFKNGVPGISKVQMNSSNALKLDNINGQASFFVFGKPSADGKSLSETENFSTPMRPAGLKFDVDYNLAVGDTASVTVVLSASFAGTTYNLPFIAKFNGSSNGVVSYTLPITYPSEVVMFNVNATSFGLGIFSVDANKESKGDGSLTIDNLKFVNASGVTVYTPTYGGFENWKAITQKQPTGWVTIAEYLLSNAVANETANPIEGSSSLILENIENPYSPSEVILSPALLGKYNEGLMPLPGFAINKEYDRLAISYKYSGCTTPDSARVIYSEYFGSTQVGGAVAFLPATGNQIKDTIISISTVLQGDSAYILLTPGRDDKPVLGCRLVVDDIRLLEKLGVGLQEELEAKSTLFPNPSVGFVSFTNEASTIKVYNVSGRELFSQSVNGSVELNLVAGTYIYELLDISGQILEKSKLIVK